jgi:hypothetical protein
MDKNCLSYWFPKLQAAGVPVPETHIVRAPNLFSLLEGGTPEGFGEFIAELTALANSLGYPCFLRTGQGSGKHSWERTCFLQHADNIKQHVYELVEWSECVSLFGLPHDVWAVRKFLNTRPICLLPRYRNMPLVREVRAFVRGGKVECHHPYWPATAITDGFTPGIHNPLAVEIIKEATDFDHGPALALAETVAKAFADDDAFSVDVLETADGWYVTDMALAARSWHWPQCPLEDAFT